MGLQKRWKFSEQISIYSINKQLCQVFNNIIFIFKKLHYNLQATRPGVIRNYLIFSGILYYAYDCTSHIKFHLELIYLMLNSWNDNESGFILHNVKKSYPCRLETVMYTSVLLQVWRIYLLYKVSRRYCAIISFK